ncbi:metallophosphoesterase family protein [Arthrobacter livingstonensis]|nr:metallophosphoesterase family protein [Arthrobacter livingstonensis]
MSGLSQWGMLSSMVRSVAVLSDIHGVLPILDAVLAEPAVMEAELIVVTGDHASGPQPTQVLDRLASLGDRVLLVRGNADRELVSLARGESIGIPDDVTPWAAAQLSPDHIALLAELRHPVSVDVEGFGPVLFCHGTPRNDEEVVLVDSSLKRWSDVFNELPEDIQTVVCGHTHMPFIRLVDRRLVINPGSIGMPYGHLGGSWALLDKGSVALHRTIIDIDAAVAQVVAESTFPTRQEWADLFIRSAASDAEALTTFSARDGRPS